MRHPGSCWRSRTAAVLIGCHFLLLVTPGLGPGTARARGTPTQLQQGIDDYKAARYRPAIAALQNAIVGDTLVGTDLIRGREYLARCYVKTGNQALAKETFLTILRVVPRWRLDLRRASPDEVSIFELALGEFESHAKETAPPPAAPAARDTARALPPGDRPTARRIGAAGLSGNQLKRQWWVYALGAAAVGGVVFAVSSGNGRASTPSGSGVTPNLPGFPPHP